MKIVTVLGFEDAGIQLVVLVKDPAVVSQLKGSYWPGIGFGT